MKKILILLCIALFALSGVSHGYGWESIVPVAWKALVLENTTGGYVMSAVPVETIRPNKSILGYAIIPLPGHSEAVVGLYDGVGAQNIASDEMFDEAEADDQTSRPRWFPYPRKILTQLNVMIGANTRVLIYWE